MSKEESTILKGVAILMMLFLHLFNKENLPDVCQPLFYIGDIPLVHLLSRAANPVAIFIILSGYGLSAVYERGNLNLRSQSKRLLKLYIHYWLILLVFVSIGTFVRPDKYPGSFTTVFLNFTSWNNSYNAEHWFLFPYALVSLTAYPLFRVIDHMGNKRALLLFFVITFVSNYVTSRYIAVNQLYDTLLARFLTYIGFFFCFALGAVMYRVHVKRGLRVAWLEKRPYFAVLLLLVLTVIRCFFKTGAFHSFYIFFCIILFLHVPLCSLLRRFLSEIGNRSMVMWLTHTFFCNYLFRDFIYGFSNPVLIYCVLLAVSYEVSIPIMKIANAIIGKIG